MTLPLRRVTVALALAVGLATVAVPSAVGATTTHHPTAISYVEHSADGDLARVRQYFLCSSATCKHDHAALKTAAASSMGRLRTQGAALRPARAAHVLRPALTLFVADVRLLETSYRAYFTATSSVKVSGLVGNVFYLTEDLASDVNVVKAAATKKKVSFSLWVVGEAATLLDMQTDHRRGDLRHSTSRSREPPAPRSRGGTECVLRPPLADLRESSAHHVAQRDPVSRGQEGTAQ